MARPPGFNGLIAALRKRLPTVERQNPVLSRVAVGLSVTAIVLLVAKVNGWVR